MKAGVANNIIVKIEVGKNQNPTPGTLKKIAKALWVGVDDLMGLNTSKNHPKYQKEIWYFKIKLKQHENTFDSWDTPYTNRYNTSR